MQDLFYRLHMQLSNSGELESIKKKYRALTTDKERFEAALKIFLNYHSVPEVQCHSKDAAESVNLKNMANRIFVSSKGVTKELVKAWNLYTKSIAMAPPLSEELAIAYANRSAVLKDLGKYEECLEDIDRALSARMNYPNRLKGNLLLRKAECLKYLKDKEVDESIGSELKRWFEDMNLSSAESKAYEEKLNSILNSNGKLSASRAWNKARRLPTLDHPHKSIPCASDAVSLQYNEKFGKHLVARRKINAGEILIVEKPFATALYAEKIYSYCAHCLGHAWAGIPCENCASAIYCSEKCKNEAWRKYHDVECSVIGYLFKWYDPSRNFLVARMAILAIKEAGSIADLKKYVEQINNCKDPLKKHFSDDGIFHSEKYKTIYPLETHAAERADIDNFFCALLSVFITYYLYIKTNFFVKSRNFNLITMSRDKNAIFLGSLILRHIQIATINACFNYEYDDDFDIETIGTFVAGFFSFLNHSCNSNASICPSKEGIILYAINPIDKGSQIYFNYGYHMDVMDCYSRKKALMENYYFECKCTMCVQNDVALTSDDSNDRDTKISRLSTKLYEKCQLYGRSLLAGNMTDKEKVLADLSNIIAVLVKRLPQCHTEISFAIETLFNFFLANYGIKQHYLDL